MDVVPPQIKCRFQRVSNYILEEKGNKFCLIFFQGKKKKVLDVYRSRKRKNIPNKQKLF